MSLFGLNLHGAGSGGSKRRVSNPTELRERADSKKTNAQVTPPVVAPPPLPPRVLVGLEPRELRLDLLLQFIFKGLSLFLLLAPRLGVLVRGTIGVVGEVACHDAFESAKNTRDMKDPEPSAISSRRKRGLITTFMMFTNSVCEPQKNT